MWFFSLVLCVCVLVSLPHPISTFEKFLFIAGDGDEMCNTFRLQSWVREVWRCWHSVYYLLVVRLWAPERPISLHIVYCLSNGTTTSTRVGSKRFFVLFMLFALHSRLDSLASTSTERERCVRAYGMSHVWLFSGGFFSCLLLSLLQFLVYKPEAALDEILGFFKFCISQSI